MSKRIICGDIHINERAIEEIDKIFEKDIFTVQADSFLQLGDFFDKNTPSPLEEKYASELILKIKQHYKEVIVLSGNGEHDIIRNTSIIEHFASLGVKTVVGDYIENDILYGHWMVKEAKQAFGSGKYSKDELNKHTLVFLGHEHIGEVINPNIYQMPSIRYVSFNEVNTKKYIAILEDNLLCPFIELKSYISMQDVTNVTDLEQIDARTKVRVIFNSFDDYKKNASYVNKIGKKFFLFKIKMNFEESKIILNQSNKLDTTISKSSIIKDYIAKIGDVDVRKLLEDQFKETI